MNLTVEQIAEEVLALPSEVRALLADRLAEGLDPLEDGYAHELWVNEALRRHNDVRSGSIRRSGEMRHCPVFAGCSRSAI